MRAVTFQAPNEVAVDDVPEPELQRPDDAIVQIDASGICGSDLHIYHGRVPVEQGFTIGHEFVGTVLAAGPELERAAVGERVLGCFHTACATCTPCIRGDYRRSAHGRTFGHGSKLGDLQGAQAERLLVPRANLTLRRVPEGMSDDVALFADDMLGTGYHGDCPRRPALRRHRRRARPRTRRAVRDPGRPRRRRHAGVRDRHRLRPSRDGPPLRRHADSPHRRGAQARDPRRHRRRRRRRRRGRRRRSRPAGPRDQPRARRRHRLRHRRVRRQGRGPARSRLAEGRHAQTRASRTSSPTSTACSR